MSRLTINVNVQQDYQDWEKWVSNTTAAFDYQLNPSPTSIEKALGEGKKVVARIYDPLGDASMVGFDNVFHKIHTPQEVANWFNRSPFARFSNDEVYFIIGWNEPERTSNAAELKEQLKWFIDVSKLLPCKVALGGWNISKTGNLIAERSGDDVRVYDPYVEEGVWDDLLKHAHYNRDRVILDIHVYTAGKVWFIPNLNRSVAPDSPTMAIPPSGYSLEWDNPADGDWQPQWHVGRSAPIIGRARALGYETRWGVGECVWDYMDDISGILEPLEQRFGMPVFLKDFRGIRSLRWYNSHLQPQRDLADVAMEELVWLDEQYPDEFEFFAVFAGNSNRDWTAFNIFHPDTRGLVSRMANYQKESQTDMYPARVFSNGNYTVFVRSTPATGSEAVGVIYPEGHSQEVTTLVSDNLVDSGGIAWREILYQGNTAWVADRYITVVPEEEEVSPDCSEIREELARVKSELDAATQRLTDLDSILSEIEDLVDGY